jgi:hypothetical protein
MSKDDAAVIAVKHHVSSLFVQVLLEHHFADAAGQPGILALLDS